MTKIEFTMPDVCHAFRRGHRVMVQVQSSWFPLGTAIPDVRNIRRKAVDFAKVTQRLSQWQRINRPHRNGVACAHAVKSGDETCQLNNRPRSRHEIAVRRTGTFQPEHAGGQVTVAQFCQEWNNPPPRN
jgi:predicted acyl esterase